MKDEPRRAYDSIRRPLLPVLRAEEWVPEPRAFHAMVLIHSPRSYQFVPYVLNKLVAMHVRRDDFSAHCTFQ